MGAALRRRDELIFGNPIRRALSGWQRVYRERGVRSAIRLLRTAYPSSPEEPALKLYDCSRTTTARRWQLGRAAGERALELLA
jgi:hypothetical protein